MDKKVNKHLRMPQRLVARIERKARADGSTFSQFLRTAAIEKLRRTEKVA